MTQKEYLNDAIELLKELIATPSVSRDESAAADVMARAISGYATNTAAKATTYGLRAADLTARSQRCCSTHTSTR